MRGRNAVAIWQELVDQHGFPGAYESVKRFVRKQRGTQNVEARAVIITEAGEEAQVDYGTGPLVRDPQTGKYRRTIPADSRAASPHLAGFVEPYLANERLRPGIDVHEAAGYVARMVVSHIGSPGRWDLTDREQVNALVRAEILAGIVE